jgi:site-specific DNA recombinase
MTKFIPSPTTPATTVALYARVSTEDQAERQTIQTQLAHLRQYCSLYNLTITDAYLDDGVSGTIPLDHRPEGSRLLQDAEAGRFGAVVLYRLDRLGRDLRVTMDAHDALQGYGVALRSSTEQLDTSTPNGRMIFQIMGSFSELEKNTITERTSGGRRRVAGEGRYTGGPIPLGYDVDEDKRFIPSERIVPPLGITEADLIRDIFQRVADGASLNGECTRLTDLGILRYARYGGTAGKIVEKSGRWGLSSLGTILHNPAYKGQSIVQSIAGPIVRPMPVLVDPALWDQAQATLTRNRTLSRKNAKRDYWLRGLIVCGTCGASYVGTASSGHRKYRCSATPRIGAVRSEPCRARMLGADWIEAAVWAECVRFIEHPGGALEEARRTLRAALEKGTQADDQRRRLLGKLAAKDQERERILTLYRKGVIDDADAEKQLDAITHEAGHLRESLEHLRAQVALLDAQEVFLTDSTVLLTRLREELDQIERDNDWPRRREIMERYVRRVEVRTIDTGRRVRDAEVTIRLRLRPEPIIAVDSATSLPGGRRWRRRTSSSPSGAFTGASA